MTQKQQAKCQKRDVNFGCFNVCSVIGSQYHPVGPQWSWHLLSLSGFCTCHGWDCWKPSNKNYHVGWLLRFPLLGNKRETPLRFSLADLLAVYTASVSPNYKGYSITQPFHKFESSATWNCYAQRQNFQQLPLPSLRRTWLWTGSPKASASVAVLRQRLRRNMKPWS